MGWVAREPAVFARQMRQTLVRSARYAVEGPGAGASAEIRGMRLCPLGFFVSPPARFREGRLLVL